MGTGWACSRRSRTFAAASTGSPGYATAELPGLRAIDTWNAAVNAHMIVINERMGFRPVDLWHNWQVEV